MAKKFNPKNCLEIGTGGSISRKAETELVAQNILVILKKAKSPIRKVSKEEYMEARKKDNNGKDICSQEERFLDIFLENYSPLRKSFNPRWAELID